MANWQMDLRYRFEIPISLVAVVSAAVVSAEEVAAAVVVGVMIVDVVDVVGSQ